MNKKGFGLLEVLAAAVVLGFLLVGLNTLQKGNRESILRVRARDAANAIAQDVIDSISALGSASVKSGDPPDIEDIERFFDGDNNIRAKIVYNVNVAVQDADEQKTEAKTAYSEAAGIVVTHQFAKKIDVTVGWEFKNTPQSISVSSVIR